MNNNTILILVIVIMMIVVIGVIMIMFNQQQKSLDQAQNQGGGLLDQVPGGLGTILAAAGVPLPI